MPRAPANHGGRGFNGEGQRVVTLRRRSRLSGHVDSAVDGDGGGQLAPGQGIAWVGGRKTEEEAAAAAPLLGIGLSREQRYAILHVGFSITCIILVF